MYGWDPPHLLSYVGGSSRMDVVDQSLLDRDSILCDVRAKLQQAQNRMKNFYDQGHRDIAFYVGTLVWLHLHTYRQKSLSGNFDISLLQSFMDRFW